MLGVAKNIITFYRHLNDRFTLLTITHIQPMFTSWAVVVSHLIEQLLSTPVICVLNQVVANFYVPSTVFKIQNIEKEPGNDPIKKASNNIRFLRTAAAAVMIIMSVFSTIQVLFI